MVHSLNCHAGTVQEYRHRYTPSLSLALGSTQLLKKRTRIFLGVKTAGDKGDDLTTFMCRVSRNSGSLTYQNPKGHQAFSGITLPYLEDFVWLTSRPEKEIRYPLYRRLGGPRGRYGWLQKMSTTHRDSISGPFSPQRFAIPTKLSRLKVFWYAILMFL
jgi:hypothetical protein